MNIKKHIPNSVTLGNLLCGTLATIFAAQGDFTATAIFVLGGIVLDFFDGFLARQLNVSGPLGGQLDSLADMVTSGVVPGIVMYNLFLWNLKDFSSQSYLPFVGLVLTLGACYRLAKFNLDTRQSDSFIGLPTPAMSLFVVSLPLIVEYSKYDFIVKTIQNDYFLVGITLVLTFLMNAEISLFSLKFKDYSFQKNSIKYLFLIASLVMIFTLQFLSVPLIIIMYVLLSVISNFGRNNK